MLNLIFKNLFRRKTRTLLTTAGIAVGVATIVALGAMGEGLRTGYLSMFSGSGADLVLMQKGAYDITLSAVDEDVVDQVAAMPEVRAATGMIVGNVTAPGAPYFFVFGYDPNGFAIERFKIVEGQALGAAPRAASSSREIVVGEQAAEALKLTIGDSLRLTGGTFRVAGVYETGSGFEEAAAVVSLTDAQQIVQKKREVGAVHIQLKDARQIDRARALANNPSLVLADEPTGNLDSASSDDLMNVFEQLHSQHDTTILIVTHDPAVARRTHRILTMQDGKIVHEDIVGDAYTEDLKALARSELGRAVLDGAPLDVLSNGEREAVYRVLARVARRDHLIGDSS